MKNSIFLLVFLALLAFVLFREATRPEHDPALSDTIRLISTIPGDSIPYEVKIETPVPYPVYHDTGSTRWRDQPIDTMAVLADYYSKYYFDDTLQNDTSALIRLQSHTFMNRLFYDKLFFQNKRVTQINSTTINPPAAVRTNFFIGAGANVIPGKQFISVDAMLVFPSGIALQANGDFMGRMLIVHGFYKINRKKH